MNNPKLAFRVSKKGPATPPPPPPAPPAPAAPLVTADDTANTLQFSSPLGATELVVSVNGGGFGAYTAVAGFDVASGKILVGNVDRAPGYYQAKVRAATGRPESPVTRAPAFASVPVVVTPPPTALTPAEGPSGKLAFERGLSYTNTDADEHGLDMLFDGDIDTNAFFGFNVVSPKWSVTSAERPERRTRLDKLRVRDKNGSVGWDERAIAYYYKAIGQAEVLLGTFDGSQYEQWQEFAVPAGGVLEHIRREVTGHHATWPTEEEPYGAQVPYDPPQFVNLGTKVLVGHNGNEYDLLNTVDFGYGEVNEAKAQQSVRLGKARWYADQNFYVRNETITAEDVGDGDYRARFPQAPPTGESREVWRISPNHLGFRTDDALAYMKQHHRQVLLEVINNRDKLSATYPGYSPGQNSQAPMAYGADPLNPDSYLDFIDTVEQKVIRYGPNATVPLSRVRYANYPKSWFNPTPQLLVGLNLIDEIGILNENTLSFRLGQYMQPEALAVLMVAVRRRVDTVAPGFRLVLMAPHSIQPGYFRALMAKIAELAGYRADGRINCPFQKVTWHLYTNGPDYAGIPLEAAAHEVANTIRMRQTVHEYDPALETAVTEFGYAFDPTSTGTSAQNTIVQGYRYVAPSASFDTPDRILNYLLRDIQTYAALGIGEALAYTKTNHSPPGQGAPWDHYMGLAGTVCEWGLAQFDALTAGFLCLGYEQNAERDPLKPTVVRYRRPSDGAELRSVWMGAVADTQAPVALNLAGKTITKYTLQASGTVMAAQRVTAIDPATARPVWYLTT